MIDQKSLAILGIILVVALYGGSIWESVDDWVQTIISGPESCFKDIAQSEISAAAGGASIKYTKTEGDELCFRTKDSSVIERLNEQIQDRKLQENLAQIEADRQFWNETFPKLFLGGLVAIIIIIIISYLSTGRGYRF